jgi:hypothetical protein
MRRTLILFATQLVLWTLVFQLNHVLTGWRIYLFVGSLFVVYSALTQPLRVGLAATLLGGLICDAQSSPETFGALTLLFAAAHVALFNLRDRVPRDDTIGRTVVALLANLALFLTFSFVQIGFSPAPAAAWPRLLMDLLCSQLFLTLVAPWVFAFQERALVIGGAERETLA